MGPVDSPAVKDFIESVNWVIPSDKRDFSRSTADWAVTFPRDSNIAEDGDPFVKQVQQTMKSPGSLGLSFFAYAGPVDGKKSGKWYTHLLNVLIQFGWALQKKFPGEKVPTIVSGGGINQGGYQAAVAMALGKKPPKKEEKEKGKKDDATVKSFQSFFSKSQPVIGKLYAGKVDGKMNPELAVAALAAESAIAKAIDDKTVHGSLFNSESKTFNTTVDDLRGALSLIQKNKGGDKVAFIDSKSRILILSAMINE